MHGYNGVYNWHIFSKLKASQPNTKFHIKNTYTPSGFMCGICTTMAEF